ncbi:MAG: GLPGLI family protein, partial [Bacteroidota bacterium]
IFATAQNNGGVVVYQETTQLQIEIPEEYREQLKGMLPESNSLTKELLFTTNESIYRDQANTETDQAIEAGAEDSGMQVKMVVQRSDSQLYKDLEKQKVYESRELFGRKFLIADALENFQWKLLNESKDILGYTCQKAIYKDTEQVVEAWFTTQIPISNGPRSYGQLPGLILELSIDNGQTQITATEVKLESVSTDEIKAPKKGKKVSQAEYDELLAEKQKEMEETYGGAGGGTRIMIKQSRND